MKRILLNIALLCAAMTMSAQQAPEKLAVDPEVRYGKLDNGLTYYIRHNEQPKQRCEFHIAQAVGAILEEDHQNGLAHFLEHMAFNGTQHFPGKGIINYFESVAAVCCSFRKRSMPSAASSSRSGEPVVRHNVVFGKN